MPGPIPSPAPPAGEAALGRSAHTADAAAELLPLVYDELRHLAAHKLASEHPGHTLQPTALVHEAYLRLLGPRTDAGPDARSSAPADWVGTAHFFAAAAEAMRRILVESARRKHSLKRGGDWRRVDLDGVDLSDIAGPGALDLLALDEALKKLEQSEPRKAEVVKLRFFAGLTNDQAAAALGVSSATAENDWAYARAWLRLELGAG